VIRFAGTVDFLDGSTVAFTGGRGLQIAWEAYAKRHNLPYVPSPQLITDGKFPMTTWAFFMAYTALDVREGFDVWAKTVADVNMDDDEDPTIPPTLPEHFTA